MHLSHILNHHGEERERYFGAVSPPIIQSSNFAFPNLSSFRRAFQSEYDAHLYTRGNNPTVKMLRDKLAELESTEDALVLGSGSAAVAAAILSQVGQGDHILCVQAPYSWTQHLLEEYLPRFGVTTTFVDGRNTAEIAAAIRPNTRVLYLESPNSLTFAIQDLRACAALARAHGLVSIIDNSYASPLYQRPAEFGIDLVVHSGTKYLNGHSDVLVGVICGSREKLIQIFQHEYMTLGAIISPHDAALVLRGLRTLELRMQRSNLSAATLAKRLAAHTKVQEVLHPLHPDFPQYELARSQMSGAGGLFSVHFRAQSLEQMERFSQALLDSGRFTLAVSWGGHESLIMPSVAFYNIPGREDSPIPWTLVRFYIGLEDPDWLWQGLAQGLAVL
ncbi:MAG: PLP-dependent transferase [Bacteroidetes bacterium]|nr:MAG: PLP-dependent transferase [Bacteroidota bacterium]